jgi:hypothetical protein
MACLAADGSLTDSGRRMLAAVAGAATPEAVAAAVGLPLYRVRAGLRELAAAGLVLEQDGRFRDARGGGAAP